MRRSGLKDSKKSVIVPPEGGRVLELLHQKRKPFFHTTDDPARTHMSYDSQNRRRALVLISPVQ